MAIHCPMCQDTNLRMDPIPEHTHQWKHDGEHFTEHMPHCTDFTCLNCGVEFTLIFDGSEEPPGDMEVIELPVVGDIKGRGGGYWPSLESYGGPDWTGYD